MKKSKKIHGVLKSIWLVALMLSIAIPQYCLAVTTEEQLKNWPAPMYQGEELKKVREWEKTWVGKKINQDNIDQIKEFLSEQFYGVFKNPKDWGADELWFEIVPYRQIVPTPGQIKYTKQKGQAVWSGQQLERTKALVLESKWKDPNATYSKEILYMDPEMWKCMQKVAWDRQGRVWRQFFMHTEMVKSRQGVVQPHIFELYSMDIQRRHGSPTLDKIKEIGEDIPNRFWTIQNLQKMGY